jgi:hypothetical protein
MLGLTWERVNIPKQRAFIPKTKNGDPKNLPIPPLMAQALTEYRQNMILSR